MDRRKDTAVEAVLEQLIEHGPGEIASVFARAFELAMQIERERFLGAGLYERTPDRRGYANGYKPKRIDTPAGTVSVQVPKTAGHDGEPFYPRSLERGRRSVRAVMLAVAEMYIKGVSTRQAEAVVREFGIESLSSSQVSRGAKLLDEELDAWRRRPLGEVQYLILDARYEKMRHGGVVRDAAVLSAIGIGPDERRRVLGVSVALSEAEVHWRGFLDSLVARGLRGVEFISSDDHAGLRAARRAVLGGATWQRCQFHLAQNAIHHAPNAGARKRIGVELRIRHCLSDHVWTAPAGQGRCSGSACGRSRPCMRRLICSTAAARPDEVRRRSGPDQWRALEGAPVRTGCPECCVAVRLPSPHVVPEARLQRDAPHRLVAGRWRPAVSSGRVGPAALAGSDQGPDHTRHPVGERDGRDLRALSLQHPRQPVGARRFAAARADPRHRAEEQQAAQVSVAGLRDPAQPFLAAGRMRLRRQTQPRRAVARRAEGPDLGRGGRQRARGQRTDAGDGCEPPRQRILGLGRLDALGHLGDPGAGVAELPGEEVQRGPCRLGRLRRRGQQAVDVVNALRLDDPELAQMRTSNPMERAVQQELKRRTAKVRVFPSEESLLRLVSAILVEIDEKWASDTKAYIKWECQDA